MTIRSHLDFRARATIASATFADEAEGAYAMTPACNGKGFIMSPGVTAD